MKTTTTLITASVCTTALAWSASPLADDDFITLASTTSTENSGLFDAIIPTFTEATGIEVNRGQATEVFPLLSRLPIARTWAGIMPFSMDGKPIIGKVSQFENLFVLTGLASSGFGRGPMSGKLLADYIHTGHPAAVLAEADPARCVNFK